MPTITIPDEARDDLATGLALALNKIEREAAAAMARDQAILGDAGMVEEDVLSALFGPTDESAEIDRLVARAITLSRMFGEISGETMLDPVRCVWADIIEIADEIDAPHVAAYAQRQLPNNGALAKAANTLLGN